MKTSTFYFPGLIHEPVQENKKVDVFIFAQRELAQVEATRTLRAPAAGSGGRQKVSNFKTRAGRVRSRLKVGTFFAERLWLDRRLADLRFSTRVVVAVVAVVR